MLKILLIYSLDTQREAETQERKKQAPCREPDIGLYPWTRTISWAEGRRSTSDPPRHLCGPFLSVISCSSDRRNVLRLVHWWFLSLITQMLAPLEWCYNFLFYFCFIFLWLFVLLSERSAFYPSINIFICALSSVFSVFLFFFCILFLFHGYNIFSPLFLLSKLILCFSKCFFPLCLPSSQPSALHCLPILIFIFCDKDFLH